MTPELRAIRRIKRFNPIQLAKMLGVLYGLMGLIFIPFFLFFSFMASLAPQRGGGPPAQIAAVMGIGFAIAMPIFYAVIGVLTGLIGGFVYNAVAKWIGGIEVEVE